MGRGAQEYCDGMRESGLGTGRHETLVQSRPLLP